MKSHTCSVVSSRCAITKTKCNGVRSWTARRSVIAVFGVSRVVGHLANPNRTPSSNAAAQLIVFLDGATGLQLLFAKRHNLQAVEILNSKHKRCRQASLQQSGHIHRFLTTTRVPKANLSQIHEKKILNKPIKYESELARSWKPPRKRSMLEAWSWPCGRSFSPPAVTMQRRRWEQDPARRNSASSRKVRRGRSSFTRR